MSYPPTSPGWKTHAALVVVQVAFASNAVEGKLAMLPRAEGGGEIHPLALTMTRIVGAAVIFQIIARARGTTSLSKRDHLVIAGLSMLGIVVNQTLFLLGLRITTPFAVSVLGCTIPVLTAGLAAIAGQERITGRTVIGIALAIAGALWLTGVGHIDYGAIVVAINCLSYSAYLVYSRKTIQRLGALTVITWAFTWGALLMAPVGLWALVRDVPAWSTKSAALAAYVVVVPTVIAYLANAWALGRSSASLVTVYIYTQPLLAGLLQWAQLGQTVTTRMLGAAVLILGGVGVVATRRASAPRREHSA